MLFSYQVKKTDSDCGHTTRLTQVLNSKFCSIFKGSGFEYLGFKSFTLNI